MTLINFLEVILPQEGVKCWTSITKDRIVQNHFCNTFEKLAEQIMKSNALGVDTYHACGTFKTDKNRRAANAGWFQCFFADVDVGKGKPYATIETAIKAVDDFCNRVGIPEPGVIRSGGGIHIYWSLDRAITNEEWLPVAQRLKSLMQAHGLHADPARTADAASILRPPGTKNYKIPGQPRPVAIDDWALFEPISADEFKAAVMNAPTAPTSASSNSNLVAGIPVKKAFDPTKDVKEHGGEYGGRNNACAAYAGTLLAKGCSLEDVLKQSLEWNTLRCKPPMEVEEVRGVVDSIARNDREQRAEEKPRLDDLKARTGALPTNASRDVIQALLQEIHGVDPLLQHVLLRTIKDKTKIPLGKLKSAMAKSGGTSEPDHLALAREVVSHVGKENLLATVAHVWRWRDTGVWRTIAEREVKQAVQQAFEQRGVAITSGLVIAVTEVLKTELFAKEHEWDRDRDAINFLNAELHWTGEAWEVRPHCREHYRTTQIPYAYDANAWCPRFVQFLEEIFQGDADSKDKKTLILELLGYTLVSHANFEAFVLLIGSGANGKSVLLDVIRVMVGSENVAAVQPSQFNNKYQRAHLHLKLANLVTEIAEGAEIADAELKAIVSGELTTAEHKFQDPFSFHPFSTCWFGSNHLPHTRDFSDALFRRAKVIPFNRKFEYGVDADPHLKDKLASEMSGIINLVLQAFAEVLKRGAFTEPESCKQAKQEWRIEADQVAQFVGEMCTVEPGAEIASMNLYQAYTNWAEAAGIARKLNRKNFTTRIMRLGGKPCKGTAGTRTIAGVRLKTIVPIPSTQMQKA